MATKRTPDGKMPHESRSSPREIQRYLGRISGPLLDRIDIHIEVPAVPVEVTTCCHPKLDLMGVRVRFPLVVAGRLKVFWRFPYVESDKCNPTWGADMDGKHRTEVVSHRAGCVDLARTLDADRYFASVAWNAGQWTSIGPHQFVLTPHPGCGRILFCLQVQRAADG